MFMHAMCVAMCHDNRPGEGTPTARSAVAGTASAPIKTARWLPTSGAVEKPQIFISSRRALARAAPLLPEVQLHGNVTVDRLFRKLDAVAERCDGHRVQDPTGDPTCVEPD